MWTWLELYFSLRDRRRKSRKGGRGGGGELNSREVRGERETRSLGSGSQRSRALSWYFALEFNQPRSLVSLLLRKLCDLQNNNSEKCGGEFAQHAVHRRNNVFAGNMFLKIKRYGKGLTQGFSADGGSG